MEEIKVIEVDVIAVAKDERWLGESFWLMPTADGHYTALMQQITKELCESSVGWRDVNKVWRIEVSYTVHTLRGPLAQRMRKHLNDVGANRKPSWDWQPVLPAKQTNFLRDN